MFSSRFAARFQHRSSQKQFFFTNQRSGNLPLPEYLYLIKTREATGNLHEFGDDCEPALLPSPGNNSKKRLT